MTRGTFSHFRLVGSGSDDQNIDADITSVGYELKIESIMHGTIQNKFDLYLFSGNDQDYNCFVMGAELWSNYGRKHECDFIKMRPDVVKPQIMEYSESSEAFLNHLSKESEVFAVIDNSGWYQAITNDRITKEDTTAEESNIDDVYFSINVNSYYKDNDIYNNVYYGFLIIAGVIGLVLVSLMIALKCLRMKYNKLMVEKAEYKQQLYLK